MSNTLPTAIIQLPPVSPRMLEIYHPGAVPLSALSQLAAKGTVFHEYYSSKAQQAEFRQRLQDTSGDKWGENGLAQLPVSAEVAEKTLLWIVAESGAGRDLHSCDLALGKWIEMLRQAWEGREYRIVVMAPTGCGELSGPAQEDSTGESTGPGFREAYQKSFSASRWTPLIISGSSQQEHVRNLDLLDPAKLNEMLATVQDRAGDGTLLFEDATRVGLRASERLLVVGKELLGLQEDDLHDSTAVELYAKPEDRYDLNDISSSEPECVQDMLNRLKQLV
ncbi:MAG: hypothetical protein KDA78_01555 [Planctomycetaceae bacterium]|nr:hypothetical protein [Planctomycetaceae bacterium]